MHNTLFQSMCILTGISFLVTIVSKYIEIYFPFYKKFCDKNVLCPTINILIIRFIHYFTTFYFVLYYFVFSSKYDLYYIFFYTILVLHWLFTNDCILSNWEMSHYNNKKNIGDEPLLHPHFRVYGRNYTDYMVLIQVGLMTYGFIRVIMRSKFKHFNYLFGFLIIFLQFYLTLKDRIHYFFK